MSTLSKFKEQFQREYASNHKLYFRDGSSTYVYVHCDRNLCEVAFRINIQTKQPDREIPNECPARFVWKNQEKTY
jgi:hypothetical protein